MSRASIELAGLLLVVAAACGGASTPSTPVAPLPAEPAPAPPAESAQAPAPTPAPAPAPTPAPPLVETIAPATVDVKVLSRGKGKRAPLGYTSTAGGTQPVELALDFSAEQKASAELGGDQETTLPTLVLVGNAETKEVAADGRVTYSLDVSDVDVRPVAKSQVPAEQLKPMLGGLKELTIAGTLGAQGAPGEVTLRLEQPDPMSAQMLEVVKNTLPRWPVLPSEPVGVGAKWRATTDTTLMDRIAVQFVTDYQLVSREGAGWTIKGTTKVVGKDQDLDSAKVSKIGGSGASEATLAEGALYPKMTSTLKATFTATESGESMQLTLDAGAAVTPKAP